LRSLEEFRKNPHVKIPPKSPCANFQSHDIFNNSIFIQKGIFLKFRPIRPSPARVSPLCPAGHRIPTRPTRPKPHCHICQKAYSLRLCALRQRCLLSLTSLPSGAHLSAPSPSPHWPTVAASPRRPRPPHAARPPTSRCQARSSLPALIPPLNPPPLTPHQAAPPSMALRPLPPAVSPSLAPVCPSLTTIKGRGAPPGHHHTHLAIICSLLSRQRPPHRAPPPSVVPHRRLVVFIPPSPPLAAGEAHRRPLLLFPQPWRGSTHGGAVPAILPRAASEAVSAVHCGPAPPVVHRTVD
jgi:hypothetical protein